ncbi:MAG: FtsX-like permease family protein [Streptosporangiaceae bacterium]
MAAPLEVVGYVLETAYVPVDVSAVAGQSGARVLAVTSRFAADGGLSRYPPQRQGYTYITPDPLGPIQINRRTGAIQRVETLPDGRKIGVCAVSARPGSASQSSPFQADVDAGLDSCFSRVSSPSGTATAYIQWSFPVLVAGIDPRAENRLTGLAGALTSGRYLRQSAGISVRAGSGGPGGRGMVVPVIGSTVSFDGDVDHVLIDELAGSAVGVVRSGAPAAVIAARLAAQHPVRSESATVTGAEAWSQLLSQLAAPVTATSSEYAQSVGQYWTVGQARFGPRRGYPLSPVPVTSPESVWRAGISVNGLSYVAAPPAAQDIGFRSLTEHTADTTRSGPVFLRLVGQFDPYRLHGFGAAGPGAPLASYRAPVLTGASSASRALLDGQPLRPDGNMAGFQQQPPLLYTTLAGAAALENPAVFSGTAAQAAAPIGSIRVRVSGLRGSVRQKLAKIAAVGQEIRTDTGLRVEVTAGASAQLVPVRLAAGRFGRPALLLSEPWTSIGVALVVLRQADVESLALFLLILLVCALFIGSAALAGVRGRRHEIGALRSLGWPRRSIFALVLGEVMALGLLAGVLGALLSAALIGGLGLAVPLWRAVLVLPVAFGLALAAGAWPAWIAARAQPLEALASSARAASRRGRRVRSVTGLAMAGIARVPGRCALAAASLAIGVTGLTVLVSAQVSFRSSIGDSALAGLVTATTRGTDLVSALLAVGLGAAAVADVTYLNLRERSAELGALAACGWGRAQIGRLLGIEALVTAAAGSLVGAAIGLAAAATAFGLSGQVLAGAVVAAVAGTVVALVGSALILVFSARQPLTAVLAVDE